ncbi:DeoR/GlpR family DNA-binding transcription regulator [Cochlodiniinecator piscidefendens]|uniref:DeoR/GlpR family DNA-binding transcription regulator n=1 Tax=Cochlodiniinecator piscidefendens TaxID=2715756 RepID=UPI00140808CF|nr:DeoR/GlpR family DNA-binding transcription regulator [Cochlodiniinecator piscidefendens]
MGITRQTNILRLAQENGRVDVDTLAQKFRVTVQTIRRDLGALCDSGVLMRTHGGAVLRSGVVNIGYEDRRSLNAQAKDKIAAMVAQKVPDAASVFLDIGTTAEAVARALLSHRDLMVVTNNLHVANILSMNTSTEVIVAGGTLRHADGGMVGDFTAEFMKNFKVDIAIISASALDGDGDLLDYDIREIRATRAVLASARRKFTVMDNAKLSRTAPVRVASLTEFDILFTDTQPNEAISQICADAQTDIRLPD